jgi:predicted DNA-binding protein YlxM (UPF0122 family)
MTGISLFSGIGGLDLAFEAAGGRVAAMCEKDDFCRKVLRKHWPDVPIFEDVKTLRGDDVLKEARKYASVVAEYASGLSIKALAEKYNVTRQAMYSVLKARKAEFRTNLRYGNENHFFRGGAKAIDSVNNLLEQAIEDGIVTRRYQCEICGVVDPRAKDGRTLIQAHHYDYNKPYDVMWLCQKCHHEWHKNNVPREVMPVKEASQQLSIDFIYGGFPQRGDLVNPSAWLVTRKDGTTIDTFGLNFRAWSPKLDRVGSLLKMSLESSTLPLTTFARTWSVSVTRSGFGVMKLRLSERRIDEQECSLWRTPDAGCARGAQSPKRFAESMKEERLLTLNDQVAHLFPTPKATDGTKGSISPEGAKKEASRGHGIDLPCHVQIFPTPTVRGNHNRAGISSKSENGLATVAGGSLNPEWVEWLMGFPPGWTDIGEASPTSQESPREPQTARNG